MIIHSAEFVKSSTNLQNSPEAVLPEYAFIGRSNVGKSSLINMLTGKKGLAKTSVKPGKTQCINHFIINNQWYLVDLPGFGFAKVSKSMKSEWDKMIRAYLLKRETLLCVFVLIDSRHTLQKVDNELVHFLGENAVPFVIVFTKTDKVKKMEMERNTSSIKKELLKTWENLPQIFLSSSEKKTGREEILGFIDKINNSQQG